MSIQSYSFIDQADPVSPQDLATKNYVDLNNRTYMCRAYRAATFNMPSTASQEVQPFIFDTLSQGSSAYYSTSTGLYTCPVSGVYLARCSISYSFSASAQSGSARIWWNNALNATISAHSSFVSAYAVHCVTLINAAAGDTISGAAQCNTASLAVRNVSSETFFAVALLGSM